MQNSRTSSRQFFVLGYQRSIVTIYTSSRVKTRYTIAGLSKFVEYGKKRKHRKRGKEPLKAEDAVNAQGHAGRPTWSYQVCQKPETYVESSSSNKELIQVIIKSLPKQQSE
jgi:hypothetical protein